MVPHLSEELWEMLGYSGGLWQEKWPDHDPKLAKDTEVEVVVQVNGRVRGKFLAPAGLQEADLVERATVEQSVAPHLSGKRIVKKIVVPDKLVNLVIV
jgi:leucyl-tRNA synthetase